MSLLDIDVKHPADGVVQILLRGELDLSTSELVERKLLEAEEEKPPTLALDLTGLTFLDSSGLRLLVAAHQRAQRDQRRFVAVRGSEIVDRVLEITHLEDELEIVDDVAKLST